MVVETHITTLEPVSQNEPIVGEIHPSIPTSVIQELFIIEPPPTNHMSIKQENIESPPMPPIKEVPSSGEERNN